MSKRPTRSTSLIAAVLVLLSLPGCRTRPTVAMEMVLPPMAPVMDIPRDTRFLMAAPVSQPLPEYPAGVARGSAARVCVEMVIGEEGAVVSAGALYALPDCPASQAELDPRFVSAAVEAARQWQFLAAAICTFPDGAGVTDDCSGPGVVVTPVAIRVSYVFSFHPGGRVTAGTNRAGRAGAAPDRR